jgi:hypothetical protein
LGYIDGLASINKDSANREPLKEMIEKNKARLLLEKMGYLVVSVESGYRFTELKDSDVYRSSFIDLNEFEELLLTSSLGIVFGDYIKTDIPLRSYKTHRQRLEYGFKQLVNVQETRGPKFVFVHFLAPHPPFVFDAQGNPVEPGWPFTIHDANLYPGSIEE